MEITILDVGQCGVDGPRIQALLEKKIHAKVVGADTLQDAIECLKSDRCDVVLVNRILAAGGVSGLDVIEQLIQSGTTTPIMLVSDHADAQDAAVKLGAVRGFGKANLHDAQTLQLIKRAAGML